MEFIITVTQGFDHIIESMSRRRVVKLKYFGLWDIIIWPNARPLQRSIARASSRVIGVLLAFLLFGSPFLSDFSLYRADSLLECPVRLDAAFNFSFQV